jgi:hypothetical protein
MTVDSNFAEDRDMERLAGIPEAKVGKTSR